MPQRTQEVREVVMTAEETGRLRPASRTRREASTPSAVRTADCPELAEQANHERHTGERDEQQGQHTGDDIERHFSNPFQQAVSTRIIS